MPTRFCLRGKMCEESPTFRGKARPYLFSPRTPRLSGEQSALPRTPRFSHHSPQRRCARRNGISVFVGRLKKIAAARRGQAVHELEARADGAAAAVVEAGAGIDEEDGTFLASEG